MADLMRDIHTQIDNIALLMIMILLYHYAQLIKINGKWSRTTAYFESKARYFLGIFKHYGFLKAFLICLAAVVAETTHYQY